MSALFPDMKPRLGEFSFPMHGECNSYMHIGGHGPADYAHIMACSRPAMPEEYAGMKRELESAPYHYKLRVVRRR
jgi:hypothetical protein